MIYQLIGNETKSKPGIHEPLCRLFENLVEKIEILSDWKFEVGNCWTKFSQKLSNFNLNFPTTFFNYTQAKFQGPIEYLRVSMDPLLKQFWMVLELEKFNLLEAE